MKLFKQFSSILFSILISYAPLSALAEEADSPFKLESSSTSVLKGTTINLIVEKGVEASSSQTGDLFVSRVQEAIYADDEQTSLLIPKGSWVTGRVTSVKSPGRLSRAGKLSLELDYLTTLTGDLFPLNAAISFESGKVNQSGVLDPQTGFKDKALSPTRKLLSNEVGQIASIATLGLPVVVTLIGGSAKAIISKGDSIGLLPGEVLKIELKDSRLLIKEQI